MDDGFAMDDYDELLSMEFLDSSDDEDYETDGVLSFATIHLVRTERNRIPKYLKM